MSKIKGVDTSVSSTPKFSQNKPSGDFTHKDLKPCGEGGCLPLEQPVGFDEVDIPEVTSPIPTNFSTVVQIVNGVVTPTLQVLLYDVLSVIDASIPNKDQNRAVKKLIHDGFDKAYLDIIREAYPDSNFAIGPGHALTPLADKSMAIQAAISKV
jgi:hypothetical protein